MSFSGKHRWQATVCTAPKGRQMPPLTHALNAGSAGAHITTILPGQQVPITSSHQTPEAVSFQLILPADPHVPPSQQPEGTAAMLPELPAQLSHLQTQLSHLQGTPVAAGSPTFGATGHQLRQRWAWQQASAVQPCSAWSLPIYTGAETLLPQSTDGCRKHWSLRHTRQSADL